MKSFTPHRQGSAALSAAPLRFICGVLPGWCGKCSVWHPCLPLDGQGCRDADGQDALSLAWLSCVACRWVGMSQVMAAVGILQRGKAMGCKGAAGKMSWKKWQEMQQKMKNGGVRRPFLTNHFAKIRSCSGVKRRKNDPILQKNTQNFIQKKCAVFPLLKCNLPIFTPKINASKSSAERTMERVAKISFFCVKNQSKFNFNQN
ncbi:MAG: hypothetical protein ILA34_00360 [Bacteroidaceae bacterium]|nr:hypothetical protein [Bacteroidaceae bacterium]